MNGDDDGNPTAAGGFDSADMSGGIGFDTTYTLPTLGCGNLTVTINTDPAYIPSACWVAPPLPPPTQEEQCVSTFYNSTLGQAVQFGSPLSLLPGWNPQAGSNLLEWGEAIFAKVGGLVGSGGMSGTTQLTTLTGTTTIGSAFELGVEALLGTLRRWRRQRC